MQYTGKEKTTITLESMKDRYPNHMIRADYDKDFLLWGIASLKEATERDITFCDNGDFADSKAAIIFLKHEMRYTHAPKKNQLYIFVDNPRLEFIRFAKGLPSSNHSVKIGVNSLIAQNAVLVNCNIGHNCTVHSGCVIGEDGFAFERDSDMNLECFPHFGKVIIENNVEIFANCNIARGSLGNTVIGAGTKIDAMCHVAHNVKIGQNCELTAGTIIGGSTTIGDNTWLGLNCTIKNKLKIGKNVIVGSGANVINDVLDGDIVAGNPAKSIRNKVNVKKDKRFLMAGQQ